LTLSIRAKLFLISIALIAISVVAGYSYADRELDGELAMRAREFAVVKARLVAEAAMLERRTGQGSFSEVAAKLAAKAQGRVTFVGPDRKVLGDSVDQKDSAELGAGAELTALLAGKSRDPVVTREGSTIHVVLPLTENDAPAGVVRVSQSFAELGTASGALERVVAVTAVLAIAVAVVMSSLASELAGRAASSLAQVARRMASGELAARSRLFARDEFGDLSRALNRLARTFSRSIGELREERDRLNALLSGMQEGMLLLDASGRIVLVNPALREMLLLGADAVGKTLLEAIRHAELKQLLDQARHAPEPLTREIEIGSIKPRRLLVRVAELSSEAGQIFAVFVDVTEMRKLESMRRDFVANVSHELRTPVTAIRSAAETLQAGVPDDPQVLAMFIGILSRNAERLQELIEDVLNLSRIESRELKLNLEPLDLRVVYGQVLSLFRERAEQKGIGLVSEAANELPRVVADRRALEHVLSNLVENAVKYCGSGSSVRASAVELEDAVRLIVSDDGPGIEARHLPRIFERFYRVDAGRSRDLGGTGLGLSIVKHLVEAMGGAVRVESTPGVGTTFSFTLKKARPETARAVA
jgi:two-component system phosphate regulon sensor histidine kinase PhoR